MEKFVILLMILISPLACISCGNSVSEYEPKNQAEGEIKTLLIQFQDCRNKHDVNGLLALFCDDAEIMVGYRQSKEHVTKKGAGERYPEIFKAFPTVEYTTPEMDISGNKATVNLKTESNGAKLKTTLDLVKDNDRWLIIKSTHESSYAYD